MQQQRNPYPPPPPPPLPSHSHDAFPPGGAGAGGNGLPTHPSPSPAPGPPAAHNPIIAARGTMVDVRIACRDLKSVSGLPSSSFAVVFSRISGKSDWVELGRTHVIPRNDNPTYIRIFQMQYRFELYQQLRVLIFEKSVQSDRLEQQAMIGATDATLGAIVSTHGDSLQLDLLNQGRGPQSFGKLLLTAEEILSAKKLVSLQLSFDQVISPQQQTIPDAHVATSQPRAVQSVATPVLPKRGAAALLNRFRKDERKPAALPAHMANVVQQQSEQRGQAQQQSEQVQTAPVPLAPFLVICRAPQSATGAQDFRSPDIPWEEVFRSKQVSSYTGMTNTISFEPISLSEYDLTERDHARFLKIVIVGPGVGPAGTIMASHITNFPALHRSCINTPNARLAMEPRGVLTVHKFHESMEPSFMDYIKGGWCDFALVCGIDFTSSNGDPRRPGTWHYVGPQGTHVAPNEYEAAMRTVANMLSSYSSDKRIPAYGFGANLPPSYTISHCFPVSEDELGQPICDGVEGLIRAYKATLARVQLYGPTIFSEVIRTVSVIVSRRVETSKRKGNSLAYTVLLLMTDGVISDYDATTAELIRLSALPVSVVIVGVGNEDFSKMHQLDGSNGILRRGAEFALRDFVQFVPYNQFKGDLSELAEKVLSKIPEQVLEYSNKVKGGKGPSH